MNASVTDALFQYENSIKPDYCHTNSLLIWDEMLTDRGMEAITLSDRWIDWYSDEYGNLRQYLKSWQG